MGRLTRETLAKLTIAAGGLTLAAGLAMIWIALGVVALGIFIIAFGLLGIDVAPRRQVRTAPP